MTVTVANTSNTNTFDYWRTRTNELAHAMSTQTVTTSGTVTGNVIVNGQFSANTLRISNSSVNTTITVPSSTQVSNGQFYLNANGTWSLVSGQYSNTLTTTNTSLQVLDTFAVATFGAAEYFVYAKASTSNNTYAGKAVVLYDLGSNSVSITEFATVIPNTSIITLSAEANASHVRLMVTPVSNSVIKLVRTAL